MASTIFNGVSHFLAPPARSINEAKALLEDAPMTLIGDLATAYTDTAGRVQAVVLRRQSDGSHTFVTADVTDMPLTSLTTAVADETMEDLMRSHTKTFVDNAILGRLKDAPITLLPPGTLLPLSPGVIKTFCATIKLGQYFDLVAYAMDVVNDDGGLSTMTSDVNTTRYSKGNQNVSGMTHSGDETRVPPLTDTAAAHRHVYRLLHTLCVDPRGKDDGKVRVIFVVTVGFGRTPLKNFSNQSPHFAVVTHNPDGSEHLRVLTAPTAEAVIGATSTSAILAVIVQAGGAHYLYALPTPTTFSNCDTCDAIRADDRRAYDNAARAALRAMDGFEAARSDPAIALTPPSPVLIDAPSDAPSPSAPTYAPALVLATQVGVRSPTPTLGDVETLFVSFGGSESGLCAAPVYSTTPPTSTAGAGAGAGVGAAPAQATSAPDVPTMPNVFTNELRGGPRAAMVVFAKRGMLPKGMSWPTAMAGMVGAFTVARTTATGWRKDLVATPLRVMNWGVVIVDAPSTVLTSFHDRTERERVMRELDRSAMNTLVGPATACVVRFGSGQDALYRLPDPRLYGVPGDPAPAFGDDVSAYFSDAALAALASTRSTRSVSMPPGVVAANGREVWFRGDMTDYEDALEEALSGLMTQAALVAATPDILAVVSQVQALRGVDLVALRALLMARASGAMRALEQAVKSAALVVEDDAGAEESKGGGEAAADPLLEHALQARRLADTKGKIRGVRRTFKGIMAAIDAMTSMQTSSTVARDSRRQEITAASKANVKAVNELSPEDLLERYTSFADTHLMLNLSRSAYYRALRAAGAGTLCSELLHQVVDAVSRLGGINDRMPFVDDATAAALAEVSGTQHTLASFPLACAADPALPGMACLPLPVPASLAAVKDSTAVTNWVDLANGLSSAGLGALMNDLPFLRIVLVKLLLRPTNVPREVTVPSVAPTNPEARWMLVKLFLDAACALVEGKSPPAPAASTAGSAGSGPGSGAGASGYEVSGDSDDDALDLASVDSRECVHLTGTKMVVAALLPGAKAPTDSLVTGAVRAMLVYALSTMASGAGTPLSTLYQLGNTAGAVLDLPPAKDLWVVPHLLNLWPYAAWSTTRLRARVCKLIVKAVNSAVVEPVTKLLRDKIRVADAAAIKASLANQQAALPWTAMACLVVLHLPHDASTLDPVAAAAIGTRMLDSSVLPQPEFVQNRREGRGRLLAFAHALRDGSFPKHWANTKFVAYTTMLKRGFFAHHLNRTLAALVRECPGFAKTLKADGATEVVRKVYAAIRSSYAAKVPDGATKLPPLSTTEALAVFRRQPDLVYVNSSPKEVTKDKTTGGLLRNKGHHTEMIVAPEWAIDCGPAAFPCTIKHGALLSIVGRVLGDGGFEKAHSRAALARAFAPIVGLVVPPSCTAAGAGAGAGSAGAAAVSLGPDSAADGASESKAKEAGGAVAVDEPAYVAALRSVGASDVHPARILGDKTVDMTRPPNLVLADAGDYHAPLMMLLDTLGVPHPALRGLVLTLLTHFRDPADAQARAVQALMTSISA